LHEPDYERLGELAAAVADGRVLDWDAIESAARDDAERASIRRLRAIAAIGLAHADRTLADSASESLSVRTLLEGVEDVTAPATWGSLRILERVGRGRFGDVYRAWDPNLEREVALKLLRSRVTETSSDRAVVKEGRLMARVRHPNVVTIHGAQHIDGRTGLWMEFIEGRTLEAELKDRGPFSAVAVVDVGRQLCRALAAVHEAGLLHRDVKAQNVLRDARGRVVLGDFGTGYVIEEGRAVPAGLAGTPAYLAPEIFEGDAASARSDIYSLGVLLFHLCTGTYPVVGQSLKEIRAGHREQRRTDLATCRGDLPGTLTATIERAIAAAPEARFESAPALETALAAAMAPAERERRPSNQTIVSGALAVVAVSALTWWTIGPAGSSRAADTSAAIVAPLMSGDPNTAAELPSTSTSDSGPIPHTPPAGNADKLTTDDRVIAARDIAVAVATNTSRVFRRIAGMEVVRGGFGTPSRDGRLLSVTEIDGELAVFEIGTGQKTRLTEGWSPDGLGCRLTQCPSGRVYDSRFSRDGSRITYVRGSLPANFGAPRMPPEIRSVATEGGPSKLIWRAPGVSLTATPGMRLFHWAGDDDLILAGHLLSPIARELMIISTATGQVVASHSAPRSLGDATLSPDGRYVAYDFVEPSSGLREINVWSVRTNITTPLIHGIASDRSPMWTADGKYVLFISSRSGTNGLWAQQVQNGQPIELPVLVYADIGTQALLGMTDGGALFVRRSNDGRDVYIADMDPQTVAMTSQPRRLSSRSVGITESPAWSADGQYVAYSRREDDRNTIVVRSLLDGMEREFPQTVAFLGRLQWEPNGGSLLFQGTVNGKGGLHRFTIGTGRITTVMEKLYQVHEILPQPGMVLFVQQQNGGPVITLNNVDSGEETTIRRLPAKSFITDLIASPKGDVAAFGVLAAGGFSLEVIDLTAPYKSREILSASSPPSPAEDAAMPVAWSAAVPELIVRRSVDVMGQRPLPTMSGFIPTTLWALDLTTRRMRVLPTPVGQLLAARVSPNGRYIAMETGSVGSEEIWTLEEALAVLQR